MYKMSRLLLLVIFFFLFSCNKDEAPVAIVSPYQDDQYLETSIGTEMAPNGETNNCSITNDLSSKRLIEHKVWQGIPSISIDKQGVLFATWLTGGKTEGDENFITVATSENGGVDWKENRLIIETTRDSTRLIDPNLFEDRAGNVYLSWSKHLKTKSNKNWAGVWFIRLQYQNNSVTHTIPKYIESGILRNKPYRTKSEDKIIFTITRWADKWTDPNDLPRLYEGTYINGKLENFQKKGEFNISKTLRNFDEHMIIEKKDGEFLGMMRTLDGIYQSSSNFTKSDFLNQTTSSRFYLGRLKSGLNIFVGNNSIVRSNMEIYTCDFYSALPKWEFKCRLSSDSHISYPDLVEDQNGNIYVIYDRERLGVGEIILAKINQKDLVAKNNVFTKTIISKIR